MPAAGASSGLLAQYVHCGRNPKGTACGRVAVSSANESGLFGASAPGTAGPVFQPPATITRRPGLARREATLRTTLPVSSRTSACQADAPVPAPPPYTPVYGTILPSPMRVGWEHTTSTSTLLCSRMVAPSSVERASVAGRTQCHGSISGKRESIRTPLVPSKRRPARGSVVHAVVASAKLLRLSSSTTPHVQQAG